MSSSLVLCTACNETYAMGGTVALVSALRQAKFAGEARVYVLDGGIRDLSWQRLAQSLQLTGRAHTLIRLKPEMARFAGLPQDWGSSVMTYARLALPELVDEPKLVYVDADMVVQGDVVPLFAADFGNAIVAASPDVVIGRLSGENLPLEQLQLSPDAPYLQAGFLIINLDLWRRENVSTRVLEYLKTWPQHAKHWDQSALNVVLYRRWHALKTTWNAPAHWAEQRRGPCNLDDAVLHFVGPHKPWLLGHHRGRAAARFFSVLDQTGWAGWRPSAWRQALKQVRYRAGLLLRSMRRKEAVA
ncbi:MAG: glycosyltransferase family 8 protein [Verrucomicrobiota bacterium]